MGYRKGIFFPSEIQLIIENHAVGIKSSSPTPRSDIRDIKKPITFNFGTIQDCEFDSEAYEKYWQVVGPKYFVNDGPQYQSTV